MEKLQMFQTAAHQRGFVAMNESAVPGVQWLKKRPQDTARDTHQLMCIDRLADNVTVFWMTARGGVSSMTFRGVPALQEWLELCPETIEQRSPLRSDSRR
jgi:hypothetical protein